MARLIDNGYAARLKRMAGPQLPKAAGRALMEGAQTIADDARQSILDGAVSGRGHVPSLPGHAPNADTHDLDQSIHVGDLIELDDRVQTAVIADSDHAVFMEFGTSKVAERPYMRPAIERNRGKALDRLVAAVGKVMRGTG